MRLKHYNVDCEFHDGYGLCTHKDNKMLWFFNKECYRRWGEPCKYYKFHCAHNWGRWETVRIQTISGLSVNSETQYEIQIRKCLRCQFKEHRSVMMEGKDDNRANRYELSG